MYLFEFLMNHPAFQQAYRDNKVEDVDYEDVSETTHDTPISDSEAIYDIEVEELN